MSSDRRYLQNDLDYIDDNAEKLGRQKMRSDAMKRQFAINGEMSLNHPLAVHLNLCRLQANSKGVSIMQFLLRRG